MGWIRCVGCEKWLHDFEAQSFALIAPVQYVLHRVSCIYETIPNASKHYETHQNMCLGSNGVDWVCTLQKIQTWHHGMNFCINCTCTVCLEQVSCSYKTILNAPKYYETDGNISSGSNGVDRVHWLRKITTRLCGTNFSINYTSSVCFATSFKQLRNDPKCTQIQQNAPKH